MILSIPACVFLTLPILLFHVKVLFGRNFGSLAERFFIAALRSNLWLLASCSAHKFCAGRCETRGSKKLVVCSLQKEVFYYQQNLVFKPFKHFHLLKKVGRKEVRAVVQQMMLILTCKRTKTVLAVFSKFQFSSVLFVQLLQQMWKLTFARI